jgi:hypothetical protein
LLAPAAPTPAPRCPLAAPCQAHQVGARGTAPERAQPARLR